MHSDLQMANSDGPAYRFPWLSIFCVDTDSESLEENCGGCATASLTGPASFPQRHGAPAVYPWETKRLPEEQWLNFIERAAADSLAAVERWPEPGDLPFGEVAAARLHLGNRLFQRGQAVKEGKDLLVAQSLAGLPAKRPRQSP